MIDDQKANKSLQQGQQAAEGARTLSDNFNKVVFTFLAEIISSWDKNNKPSSKELDALVSVLLNGKILDQVAELLRNDSLQDAAKRIELYNAVLRLLYVLGAHNSVSERIFKERSTWPDNINLLGLSFKQYSSRERNRTGSSLANSLRNLNIQSDMMLKGARGNKFAFADSE
jgi:baculoviral IAP repeat-containing protein 6